MIKDIKLNRIKSELNKPVSLLTIKDGTTITWVMDKYLSAGAYYNNTNDIMFDTKEFMDYNGIVDDDEQYDLLKGLLNTKLHELFKDKLIKNIKFL